jgi:hypothetical protein
MVLHFVYKLMVELPNIRLAWKNIAAGKHFSLF